MTLRTFQATSNWRGGDVRALSEMALSEEKRSDQWYFPSAFWHRDCRARRPPI